MSWLGPLQHISFDYSIKYGPFACSIQFIFKQLAFPFVGFGKHFLHLPTSSSLPSPLWALANTFSTCQLPAPYLPLCGPWQTLSPLVNFQQLTFSFVGLGKHFLHLPTSSSDYSYTAIVSTAQ